MELSDQWSCHYCFCFLPDMCCKICVQAVCCFSNVHDFCKFIHCYDVFDGTGEYNRTSCRKDPWEYQYCLDGYNPDSLNDRCFFCCVPLGPFWIWPSMAMNCFNLVVIKNVDRCCVCVQDNFCYRGKCCYSKKKDELRKRNRISLEQEVSDLARRIDLFSTGEVISQSGFSYDGVNGHPSSDPSRESGDRWIRPPPEDQEVPPPYPETICSQI